MEKKRQIALTAVNSRSSHTNLALYYIKRLLKYQEGTNTDLIELTINENWKQSLMKLTKQPYDYYLFSVYIWNSDFIEELVPLLKKICPHSKIILGGPEITYNLEKWKKTGTADVLIQGQAESFIPQIFSWKNPVFRSRNTPLNSVPFPYEPEDYANLKGRLVYYEASRGCLFNCSYCLSSCSDQKLEYRDLGTVKKELKVLISIEPKIVKMVDRTFNSRRDYAREIWQFLIDEKSPVPFHFELHPLFLEEEDFSLLETAPENLFHFEVGIQSTDESVLKAVDRPYNWPKEKENIQRLCSLKNIHIHLDQIAALPLDNKESAEESFNEILSLSPDEFQLGFLKILPGTTLAKKAETYGMVVKKSPPYEVVQTSTMSFTEIREFYNVETDLGRFYNSHYFHHTIKYLLENSSSPWAFFTALMEFSPADKSVKRWAVLGECLLKYGEEQNSGDREYRMDLLRLDWCPFASGQNYPPFLKRNDGETTKENRRAAYPFFSKSIAGFTRRDYNRSILFVPTNERLIEELDSKAILFYRSDSIGKYKIDLKELSSPEENLRQAVQPIKEPDRIS